jgi:hypothetical protein
MNHLEKAVAGILPPSPVFSNNPYATGTIRMLLSKGIAD